MKKGINLWVTRDADYSPFFRENFAIRARIIGEFVSNLIGLLMMLMFYDGNMVIIK